MRITDKYEALRALITNGSVILFRGSSALSRTIQWADNAYYNHSGLVFAVGERLMILDSNAQGVRPEFLSERIKQYVDFCIIKPIDFPMWTINEAVEKAINKDASRNFKYDFLLLPKVLVSKKIYLPINHSLINSRRTICSVFTGFHYAIEIGFEPWTTKCIEQGYFTPQDHLRYINDKMKVIGNDYK